MKTSYSYVLQVQVGVRKDEDGMVIGCSTQETRMKRVIGGLRKSLPFCLAGIAGISRTGEQSGTSRFLFRFVLNSGPFWFVLAFPANFGHSGRKMRFSMECNSSAP